MCFSCEMIEVVVPCDFAWDTYHLDAGKLCILALAQKVRDAVWVKWLIWLHSPTKYVIRQKHAQTHRKHHPHITETADSIEAVDVWQFSRHGRHFGCGSKDATGSETFVLMWFACASVGFSSIFESVITTSFWWRLKLLNNKFWHGFNSSCSGIFNFVLIRTDIVTRECRHVWLRCFSWHWI